MRAARMQDTHPGVAWLKVCRVEDARLATVTK
jgi:hypothetical protein